MSEDLFGKAMTRQGQKNKFLKSSNKLFATAYHLFSWSLCTACVYPAREIAPKLELFLLPRRPSVAAFETGDYLGPPSHFGAAHRKKTCSITEMKGLTEWKYGFFVFGLGLSTSILGLKVEKKSM